MTTANCNSISAKWNNSSSLSFIPSVILLDPTYQQVLLHQFQEEHDLRVPNINVYELLTVERQMGSERREKPGQGRVKAKITVGFEIGVVGADQFRRGHRDVGFVSLEAFQSLAASVQINVKSSAPVGQSAVDRLLIGRQVGPGLCLVQRAKRFVVEAQRSHQL
jgi:hypothetical protein